MTSVLKRGFVGRPVRSDKLEGTLLPKKIALPVFASDALSSVSYATEEILLVLTLGGLSFIHFTWWIAVGVAVLMLDGRRELPAERARLSQRRRRLRGRHDEPRSASSG